MKHHMYIYEIMTGQELCINTEIPLLAYPSLIPVPSLSWRRVIN